jgi:predicted DsbA family dithiol-disulfide isomerase
VAEALFAAFFERGVDIGDRQTLRALARKAGLRSDALDQPGWAQQVVRAHADACRFGINGVPICAFGEDHVIAGAQPEEALQILLDLERYRLAGCPS